MKSVAFVVSCEHAVNTIPDKFQFLFANQLEVLESHRAWDPGSHTLGVNAAARLKAPLFTSEVSRLLVECNRSIGHEDLFSEFSNKLLPSEKAYLLDTYYDPYRKRIEKHVSAKTPNHMVIHLSMHSFTPIWNGVERKTDVGILFDAKRESEAVFCEEWQHQLQALLPTYHVALNEPYNGADDGLTTHLRQIFDDSAYLGIELEINQKWVGTPRFHFLSEAIINGLLSAIDRLPASGN